MRSGGRLLVERDRLQAGDVPRPREKPLSGVWAGALSFQGQQGIYKINLSLDKTLKEYGQG